MRRAALLALAGLLASVQVAAEGMPPVPKDYPSHSLAGSCYQASLSEQLQSHNITRLQLADIMRRMADEPAARDRLMGYADNLDGMRDHLPPPDPDSHEFRNFDFQLGITLTAMTLFLNTEDEHITRRFTRDRDDPQSELGLYLVRLEQTREQYMHALAVSRETGCKT